MKKIYRAKAHYHNALTNPRLKPGVSDIVLE